MYLSMVTSAKTFFTNTGSHLAHKLEITILSGFTTINLRKPSAWLSSSHKIRHQCVLSFSLKGRSLEKAQEDRDVCEQPSGSHWRSDLTAFSQAQRKEYFK